MDIRNEIIKIFEENGVDPLDKDQLKEIDSIQYISIIVEIEQVFKITLPDFLLDENGFEDLNKFVDIITNII